MVILVVVLAVAVAALLGVVVGLWWYMRGLAARLNRTREQLAELQAEPPAQPAPAWSPREAQAPAPSERLPASTSHTAPPAREGGEAPAPPPRPAQGPSQPLPTAPKAFSDMLRDAGRAQAADAARVGSPVEPAPTPAAAPAAPAQADASRARSYDRPPEVMLEELREREADETRPGREAAATAFTWLAWLYQKRRQLAEMPESEQLRMLGIWWERIDRYVWSDVGGSAELAWERMQTLFGRGEWEALLALLGRQQEQFRDWLAQAGVERLTFGRGDPFRPGLLEPKPGAEETTPFRDLDQTAAEVAPGDAGYRYRGTLKRPSQAPRLRYVPPTTP